MAATCYLLGVSTRRMDKLVQSLGTGRLQRLGEVRCVLEAADLEPVPDPEAGVDGPDDRRVVGALEEPQVEDGFACVPGEQHPSRRGPRVVRDERPGRICWRPRRVLRGTAARAALSTPDLSGRVTEVRLRQNRAPDDEPAEDKGSR